MTQQNPEKAATPPSTEQPVEKKAKARRRGRRLLVAALIGVTIVSFSIAPLWRLMWYYPVYSFRSFGKIKDLHGQPHEAWRWIESRTIRIWHPEGITPNRLAEVEAGVQALLDDAGLDFTVESYPISDEIAAAIAASRESVESNGRMQDQISFEKLQSRLIEQRQDSPHADILIIDEPIAEAPWAFGLSSFRGGVAVLQSSVLDQHLAKHETAHLMGYMMHDNFPLFVIGYPWEGWPWKRDTLMLLLSSSEDLSPRARDALKYFWKGIEHRTGKQYLRPAK